MCVCVCVCVVGGGDKSTAQSMAVLMFHCIRTHQHTAVYQREQSVEEADKHPASHDYFRARRALEQELIHGLVSPRNERGRGPVRATRCEMLVH